MSSNSLSSIGLYSSAEKLGQVCAALDRLAAGDLKAVPEAAKLGDLFAAHDWDIQHSCTGLMLFVDIDASTTQDPWELIPFLRKHTTLFTAEAHLSQTGGTQTWYAIDGKKVARKAYEARAVEADPTLALLVGWRLDKARIVQEAIRKGANVNVRLDGELLLSRALYDSSLVDVQTLLEAGADPNAKDGQGMVVFASAGDSAEKLKALLAAGANVNATDDYNTTALHRAVSFPESDEALMVLLEAGADPNAGDPPACLIALHQIRDPELGERTLKALSAHGADFNGSCAHGGNARWYAGHDAIAHRFLDGLGIDKTIRGATRVWANYAPVQIALDHAHGEKLMELIDAAATLSPPEISHLIYEIAKTEKGRTLKLAPWSFVKPCLEAALERLKPDLSIASKYGRIPFGHSVRPEAQALLAAYDASFDEQRRAHAKRAVNLAHEQIKLMDAKLIDGRTIDEANVFVQGRDVWITLFPGYNVFLTMTFDAQNNASFAVSKNSSPSGLQVQLYRAPEYV